MIFTSNNILKGLKNLKGNGDLTEEAFLKLKETFKLKEEKTVPTKKAKVNVYKDLLNKLVIIDGTRYFRKELIDIGVSRYEYYDEGYKFSSSGMKVGLPLRSCPNRKREEVLFLKKDIKPFVERKIATWIERYKNEQVAETTKDLNKKFFIVIQRGRFFTVSPCTIKHISYANGLEAHTENFICRARYHKQSLKEFMKENNIFILNEKGVKLITKCLTEFYEKVNQANQ